jgi:hypothetical protein
MKFQYVFKPGIKQIIERENVTVFVNGELVLKELIQQDYLEIIRQGINDEVNKTIELGIQKAAQELAEAPIIGSL